MQAGKERNKTIINGCLTAAVAGTGFDAGELWRSDVTTKQATMFQCVSLCVPVPKNGLTTDIHKEHVMSPELCAKAKLDKMPLWFTTASHMKVMDETTKVQTAVVIPIFSYELQKEFYSLFFALRSIPSSPQMLAMLRELSRSVVLACGLNLEEREDDDETDDAGPPLQRIKLNDVSVLYTKPRENHFVTFSDLQQVQRVDEGGFSSIYTAVFQGKPVCVKMLTEECNRNPRSVADIRSEIEMMVSLHHPNIVRYIASGQEPRMFVVMEYIPGGSLKDKIAAIENKRNKSLLKWRINAPKFRDTLPQILQLAQALSYMHTSVLPDFVFLHRDLKPDNIVFMADGTVKLIDFGIAKAIPRASEERQAIRMSGQAGSLRYMAPEVALNKPYDESADVYSFSIVAWEMASYTRPFQQHDMRDFIKAVARGGERPDLKQQKWPAEFSDLLQECWSADPKMRPTMPQVVVRLRKLSMQFALRRSRSLLSRTSSMSSKTSTENQSQ